MSLSQALNQFAQNLGRYLRLCELIFIVHIVINLLSRTIASEMRSFI